MIVWADGKPARGRTDSTEREVPPNTVVREGDIVGVYVSDISGYDTGAQSWAHLAVDEIVALVHAKAPGMTIDVSAIDYALKTNSGNKYAAVEAAQQQLDKAIDVRAPVLKVDLEKNTLRFAEVWQMEMGAPLLGVFDLVGVREQQLGEADDHREGVVEVVRDAARELAERLQPLLAQHHLLGVLDV